MRSEGAELQRGKEENKRTQVREEKEAGTKID